jgi:hypothetical protein
MIDNLPSSLTHLTLGLYFNQMINNLPSSLTHLTLGGYFNHIIKKIPKNIKKIYVVDGEQYEQIPEEYRKYIELL